MFSGSISLTGNSHTPWLMALLSKGQGSSESYRNYITVQWAPFSESLWVRRWSCSSQDVFWDSCSFAGCFLCHLCAGYSGDWGERLPEKVWWRGQYQDVPVLTGIMGLQYQHHGGELGQTGRNFRTIKMLKNIVLVVAKEFECKLQIYNICWHCRQSRDRFGALSTPRSQKSPAIIPSTR